MVELFRSGGVMMWPMLMGLIAVLVVGGRAALSVAADGRAEWRSGADGRGGADIRSAADAVLFWGGFSALLGVMGTLVGIAIVARAVERAGSVGGGVIWSGIGVSLITTVFGLLILLLALVVWYGLRTTVQRRGTVAGAVALGLASGLSACGFGDSARDAVVRADSAGVEIVTSSATDAPLGWAFERLWSVGDESDELLFGELPPFHVGASADGRVYVLDENAHQVAILSREGRLAAKLGRGGKGPGELSSPLALSVAEDGTVSVFDYERGGLVRWSGTGEALDLVRVDAPFWGPAIAAVDGGAVFTALEGARAGTSTQRLLLWTPDDQTVLTTLTRAEDVPAEFPTCGIRGIPISRMFEPELVWSEEGGTIAAATGVDYVVDVFDGHRNVRSLRRPIEPRPVDREMALREAGDGMFIAVSNCTIPPEELVRGRGHADVLPAVRQLVISPAGEVWVERGQVADEPSRIDVFSADGAYLGTLPEGSPFPVAFTGRDRFVAIDRDELGTSTLVAWSLTRS